MRAALAGILSALLVVMGHGAIAGPPDAASVRASSSPPVVGRPGTAVAGSPAHDRSAESEAEAPGADIPPDVLTEVVVRRVCQACHNDALRTGNLSLEEFEVGAAPRMAPTAEKMIVKLRAGMMPPPGVRRPGGDTLLALVETMEALIDQEAARDPDPGDRPFQRLNRAEYEASVRQLLDLEIDAGDYLPLDTKSANFDNIADVQVMSATLMSSYLRAAADVARLAVGNPDAQPAQATYSKSGYHSQWDRVPGAPRGTRGGISVVHNFPADGEYALTMAFDHTTTGGFYGDIARGQQIEVSVDGERRLLLDVDQFMHVSDPNMVEMTTEPIAVGAGPHRVSAVFLRRTEGPVPDLLSPHDWSLADRRIGSGGYGITALPHMKDLVIRGPFDVTGVSETPSRRKIFSCRPAVPEAARPCARRILSRLAAQAYRRPVDDGEVEELLAFYDLGAGEGGFEIGVRTALEAILVSPDFVFRFEEPGEPVESMNAYRIRDAALASRLSFFLWGAPPDRELRQAAAEGRLSRPEVLEAQTRRMLADPRAEALGTRFAAQWLRLQDLDKVHPDRLRYPDFDQELADAMRRETELLFYSLVREDRSLLDLYTADYTYVNERLARHYGIPDVVGDRFRRVELTDERRRGLLGHGSVLVLTSHATRTSPVLRGKWVMEVLLGTPPPPPPPGVPDLEQTEGSKDGRMLTTRERMEMHRANPVCASCHRFMDPIGLALDNFDVTGRWRIREHGMPLDTRGEMYDGTAVESPADLRRALLRRPIPLVRTFTENLMAYALGRRVEYFDKPTVRRIARQAEAQGYRMSAFILGVVRSPAFQMKRPRTTADQQQGGGQER